MKEKLDGTQARPTSNCSNELKGEVLYLKRTFRSKWNSKYPLEVKLLKKVVKVRHKTNPTKDGDALRLSFVQVTVHDKKFSTLVDTRATHSFLSRKAATSFGKKVKMERELSAFKSINSTMKVVAGVFKNTQVRVGSWFDKLDLRVTDMDVHAMVLGKDFLIATQAIPMVDCNILLIIVEGETMIVLMTRKSFLGYRPRIASMNLYPKDPNVKHDYVEQR